MPVNNGHLWTKRHSSSADAKFTIEFTGEKFTDRSEWNRVMEEYGKKQWRPRHRLSQPTISFEESMEQEQSTIALLRDLINKELLADLLRVIHHSFLKQCHLVDSLQLFIDNHFYNEEMVRIVNVGSVPKAKRIVGIIEKSPDFSDKENSNLFSIKLIAENDPSLSKTVRGIPAEHIRRERAISNDHIEDLISLFASRNGEKKAWTIDESYRREFGIADKIHALFAGSSKSPSTKKTSSLKVDKVSSPRAKKANIETIEQPIAKKAKVSGTMKEDDDEPLVMFMRKPELKKFKDVTTPGSSISKTKTPLLEKAPKKKNSIVKSTPARVSIAKFFAPAAASTPATVKKVDATIAKIRREVEKGDYKAVKNSLLIAAKSLRIAQIEALDDLPIREAILFQCEEIEQRKLGLKKNRDEKEKQADDENKIMRLKEWQKIRKKLFPTESAFGADKMRREDTEITNAKPLPDLLPIEQGIPPETAQYFPSVLMISVFMGSFRHVIDCDQKTFSADEILRALTAGVSGYFAVTGPILDAFLKTLMETAAYCDFGGINLAKLHIHETTAPEISRLLLSAMQHAATLKESNSPACELGSTSAENGMSSGLTLFMEALVALEKEDFWNCGIQHQIAIMEALIDRLLLTDFLNESIVRRDQVARVRLEGRNELQAQLETEKKHLHILKGDLPVENAAEELKMTREQTRSLTERRHKVQLAERHIAELTEKFNKAETRLKEFRTTQSLCRRTESLGSDRFNRRYWFFEQSNNGGIFIEEQSSDNESDASHWWTITSEIQLKQLIVALNANGIRESQLKSRIRHFMPIICRSFHSRNEWKPFGDGLVSSVESNGMNQLRDDLSNLFEAAIDEGLCRIQEVEVMKQRIVTSVTLDDARSILLDFGRSLPERVFRRSGCASFDSWVSLVESASTISRLDVLIYVLEQSVDWSKSLQRQKCSVCHRKRKADQLQLLICENCEIVMHAYCARPRLKEMPEGNWTCRACVRAKKKEEMNASEEDDDEDDEEGGRRLRSHDANKKPSMDGDTKMLHKRMKQRLTELTKKRAATVLVQVPKGRTSRSNKLQDLNEVEQNLEQFSTMEQFEEAVLAIINRGLMQCADNSRRHAQVEELRDQFLSADDA